MMTRTLKTSWSPWIWLCHRSLSSWISRFFKVRDMNRSAPIMSVENTCSRSETPLARDINSIDWSWFFCSKQLMCYKHSANRCWHQCCSVNCWFLKCNNSNWATVAGPTHGLAWLHDAQWQFCMTSVCEETFVLGMNDDNADRIREEALRQ